jgi:hypothetical protein
MVHVRTRKPGIFIVWDEHHVGERHYSGSGLERSEVESAIRDDILRKGMPEGGAYPRGHQLRIVVRGVLIEYHPFRRSDGTIEVNTHFPVR